MELEYRSFVKNEILCFMEHSEVLTPDGVISRMNDIVGRLDENFPNRSLILASVEAVDYGRIVTSTDTGGAPFFSFVPLNLPVINDADLIQTLFAFYEQSDLIDRNWWYGSPADPTYASPAYALRAIGPNWYSPAANGDRLPTGGPGGKPIRADRNVPIHPPNGSSSKQTSASYPVTVCVLDTAYPEQEIVNALATFPQNSLLEQIVNDLNAHVRITMNYSPLMDLLNDPKTSIEIEGHEDDLYLLTDHGLFIAGMIYDMTRAAGANDVDVHLIQVLGNCGIGTVDAMLRALQVVDQEYDGERPTIVNCSFTLAAPRVETIGSTNPQTMGDSSLLSAWALLTAPLITVVISEGGELVKKQVSLLELSLWGAYATVGRLHRRGVRFVAAAGNDRQKAISMFVPTPPKPAAAYPAALPDVIGVAALDRVGVGMNPKATDYSNLADKPAMEGVAVFGGKTDRFNYTVSDQGVNGLYIGSLPPDVNGNPQINDEGWAEWAGTSFAAPIITAMLAMDAATGIPLDTAISNLFNQSPRSTQDNEPIIEVTK